VVDVGAGDPGGTGMFENVPIATLIIIYTILR